jgi:phosphoserine phosphatase
MLQSENNFMNKIYIYDLDGTLSKLNNTFDFIYHYFIYSNLYSRAIFGKLAHKIIDAVPFFPYPAKRRLIINLLFKNLIKKDLEFFFTSVYETRFLSNLTSLGQQVYSTNNHQGILLTGCTEIPANQIAELLGFKRVICTELKTTNDKIKVISKDTFGNYKAKFISKQKDDYLIYYTDDLETENELIQMMDETILINSEIS